MTNHAMKTWLLALFVIAGGTWALRLSRAQPVGQLAELPSASPLVAEEPAFVDSTQNLNNAYRPVRDETARGRSNVGAVIRQAAEAVRDAQGDQAKTATQAKLADLLGRYFDDDMARRESELTRIEERLANLRELHNRRRDKRQEILDLQIKVALNEAEGLGFYGDKSSANRDAGFGMAPSNHSSVFDVPDSSEPLDVDSYPRSEERLPAMERSAEPATSIFRP